MARLLHSKNCLFVPFNEAPTGKDDIYDTDKAIQLKWLNSFETSYERTDMEWLGDGTYEERSSKLDYVGVTMTFSTSMPLEDLALLTGMEYIQVLGMVATDPTGMSIRGALLWEDVYSDNVNSRLGYYNISLTLTETPRETDSDGSDALYTFEGSAIPYHVREGLGTIYDGGDLIEVQMSQRLINKITDPGEQANAQNIYDQWFEFPNQSLLPAMP